MVVIIWYLLLCSINKEILIWSWKTFWIRNKYIGAAEGRFSWIFTASFISKCDLLLRYMMNSDNFFKDRKIGIYLSKIKNLKLVFLLLSCLSPFLVVWDKSSSYSEKSCKRWKEEIAYTVIQYKVIHSVSAICLIKDYDSNSR